MGKKGQVTLFVILAIVIVVAGVLIYSFLPKMKSSTSSQENPSTYIQSCVSGPLINYSHVIAKNGGTLKPDHSFVYLGQPVDYLCYTNKYFTPCTVEKPMLVSIYTNQLTNSINSTINSCFDSLVKDYQKKGYSVNLNKKGYDVKVLMNQIFVTANYTLTVSKAGNSQTYNSFNIIANSNIYQLLSIAYNIVNWETIYGDADVNVYMDFNPDVKLQKVRQENGTKVYVIDDRNTKEEFRFATRSLVMAPGS